MKVKQWQGEVEHLSAAVFETTFDEAILSHDTAEQAIIYLISCYEFNLDDVKDSLAGTPFKTTSLHVI